MNVRRRIAHATAVLAALGLSLGLSSCGFDVQTNKVYNPAAGVSNQNGSVDVLNALIVSDSEGSGTLVAGLANKSQTTDDALVGVNPAGGADLSVTMSGDTKIPAGGLLNLADQGGLAVSGAAVKAGDFVKVTFTFKNSEAATLDVPVVEGGSGTPYSDISPSASPS